MKGKGEKLKENRPKKYFKKPLDTFGGRAYSPPPVAILKGIVTSERIGERCGDTTFEDSSKRLVLLPLTPHAEAERLGAESGSADLSSGRADKNATALART
jgi:hypothetical protein